MNTSRADHRVDSAAEPPGSPESWSGPALWRTLRLFALPVGATAFFGLLYDDVPRILFVPIAVLFGALFFVRLRSDKEPLLALAAFYLPLSRIDPMVLAPGIDAINLVDLLLVYAWISSAWKGGYPLFERRPGVVLAVAWAVLSIVSFFTEIVRVGLGDFFAFHGDVIKTWLDQFFVFFPAVSLIRDGKTARRVALYTMLSSLVVLIFGLGEWWDKRDVGNLEHSRLLGPQMQPNSFGGYLAYTAAPFVGLALIHALRPRIVLFAPYAYVLARVVISTFSRGAYIGLGLMAVAMTFFRGRIFSAVVAAILFGVVSVFPAVVPESMMYRLNQTTADAHSGQEFDRSAETRLILWNAAIKITEENPILGMGFDSFRYVKSHYTERDVDEVDNHNMYLYVASQMGIPALMVFVSLFLREFFLGVRVYRRMPDDFGRALGLGGIGMAVALIGVNMFGSRMVDIDVSANFWIYFAALSVLSREAVRTKAVGEGVTRA